MIPNSDLGDRIVYPIHKLMPDSYILNQTYLYFQILSTPYLSSIVDVCFLTVVNRTKSMCLRECILPLSPNRKAQVCSLLNLR